MRKTFITLIMGAVLAVPALAVSDRTPVGFGELFYEGDVVRTLVPPAAAPQEEPVKIASFLASSKTAS